MRIDKEEREDTAVAWLFRVLEVERMDSMLHYIGEGEETTLSSDDLSDVLNAWFFILESVDCLYGPVVALLVVKIETNFDSLAEAKEAFGDVVRVVVVECCGASIPQSMERHSIERDR